MPIDRTDAFVAIHAAGSSGKRPVVKDILVQVSDLVAKVVEETELVEPVCEHAGIDDVRLETDPPSMSEIKIFPSDSSKTRCSLALGGTTLRWRNDGSSLGGYSMKVF